jgi:hypothetical protein
MTIENFVTDIKYMRGINDDIFINKSDSELLTLFYDYAFSDLINDMQDGLRLDVNSDNYTEIMNEAIDKNTEMLQIALAARQLYYYYLQNNDGAGSATERRTKFYLDRYNFNKSKFVTMLVRGNMTVTTKTVKIG